MAVSGSTQPRESQLTVSVTPPRPLSSVGEVPGGESLHPRATRAWGVGAGEVGVRAAEATLPGYLSLPAEPSWAPTPPPATSPIFLSHLTRADYRGCCFILASSAPRTLRGTGTPAVQDSHFPSATPRAQGGASPTPALPAPPLGAWGPAADWKGRRGGHPGSGGGDRSQAKGSEGASGGVRMLAALRRAPTSQGTARRARPWPSPGGAGRRAAHPSPLQGALGSSPPQILLQK